MIKTTTMAAVVATLAGTAFAAGIMTPSAFAAADTNAANDIVISDSGSTNPQASVKDHTFTAYKLANYTNPRFNAAGDKVEGYDLTVVSDELNTAIRNAIKDATTNTVNNTTTVKDAFKATIAIDGNGIKFIGDAENLTPVQFVGKYFYGTGSDVYGNEMANKAEMRTFADSLVKSGALTDGVESKKDADNKARFDFNDDEAGIYIITEKAPDANNANGQTTQTISRAMVTGTPIKNGNKYVNTVVNTDGNREYTLGELNLKADAVTIDKETTAVDGKDTVNDALIGVGSKRTFTIKTNVPNYMNDYQDWKRINKAPKFIVGNNPTDNMTVNRDTVKVAIDKNNNGKIDNGEELTKGTDYTVTDRFNKANGTTNYTEATQDANDFQVNFKLSSDAQNDGRTDGALDEAKLKNLSGANIIITYDATIDSLTDVTENGADVDYSNNPYEDTTTTSHDNERLYQAELQLEKIKFNEKATLLDGAKFAVTDDQGNPIKFVEDADNGVYTQSDKGTVSEVTLNSKKLNRATVFKGLAKDVTDSNKSVNYHFKETKAADGGYILGDKPVEFTVNITPVFMGAVDNSRKEVDGAGELIGVKYTLSSAVHDNFLDLSDGTVLNGDTIKSDLTDGNSTVIQSGIVRVENTTDLSDFAKTGGEISAYILSAVALAVAGAFVSVLARRNRAKKTA